MRNEEKKGSALTSIIAALIFVLVLAIFGRSVQGAKNHYPSNNQSSAGAAESRVIGSGFYRIHVLDEAKHHFIPSFRNLD